MSTRPSHSGFEPRTRDPERRDFFDLRRRIAQVDGGGGGGGTNFIGTIPTPGPPTDAQVPPPHADGDYVIDSAGNGWMWNGTAWVNVGSIKGPAGPQGPPGPTGPPGATPTVAHTHTQATVASVWNIVHMLGYKPNITVVDSGGSVVEGDTIYVDSNNVQLLFSAAFSGTAHLS